MRVRPAISVMPTLTATAGPVVLNRPNWAKAIPPMPTITATALEAIESPTCVTVVTTASAGSAPLSNSSR